MKTHHYIIAGTAILLTLAFAVSAIGMSHGEACKRYGDFIDSRTWDLELQPTSPGTYYSGNGVTCFDPVDGRQYQANAGAMSIILGY